MVMTTDAITLLKEDHKTVKKLFRDFEAAGANATTRKRDLVARIIEELTVHTYIENEIMYPEVRKLVPSIEDDILESYEEHHVADVLCLELFTMSPEHDHFDAKTTVLIENVEHHIKEEEDEWFPKVREALGRKELSEIGARMLEAKKKAPKTPIAPKALKKAFDALVK
jgi:hemerythrin superfamily protein